MDVQQGASYIANLNGVGWTMLVIVFLALWLGCIVLCVKMAETRNRETVLWGILGAMFGLFAVLLLVIVGQGPPPLAGSATRSNTRKCPACAEFIKAEAVKCRYCGTSVESLVA